MSILIGDSVPSLFSIALYPTITLIHSTCVVVYGFVDTIKKIV